MSFESAGSAAGRAPVGLPTAGAYFKNFNLGCHFEEPMMTRNTEGDEGRDVIGIGPERGQL